MNRRIEALQQAQQYVTVDRNSRHGDPEDNFLTIAQMWQAYADRRGWSCEFTRADVAMLCVLLKAARSANDPSYLDNYLDIIGYGACAYEVAANANDREEAAASLDTVAQEGQDYPLFHLHPASMHYSFYTLDGERIPVDQILKLHESGTWTDGEDTAEKGT